MNTVISVIVPVYQSEQYLDKCLKSILHQTQPNLEIILIDDGSTDRSGEICDQYANAYTNIKVLHKKNEGLTAAWKSGIILSKGEFIGFVDSDDWIAEDMYARLYQEAKKTNADIVCCGIRHVFEQHTHEDWEDQMQFPKEVYTQKEMQENVYPVFINNGRFMGRGLQPNRVSKLIRRKLILANMHLCDERVTVGEDYQFSFAMFLDAGKIAILKDFLPYYYRINDRSMTGQYDIDYLDKIKIMKKELNRISDCKNVYNFKPQILNDFLCLTILHIKGGIVAHRKDRYHIARKDIKKVCTDSEVRYALKNYSMTNLSLAERMFIFFMKHHLYLFMYLSITLYFRSEKRI